MQSMAEARTFASPRCKPEGSLLLCRGGKKCCVTSGDDEGVQGINLPPVSALFLVTKSLFVLTPDPPAVIQHNTASLLQGRPAVIYQRSLCGGHSHAHVKYASWTDPPIGLRLPSVIHHTHVSMCLL